MNEIKNQTIIDHWNNQGLQIDLQQGRIIRDGKTQFLEPLVLDLLQMLLAAPNEVVSKSEIFDKLWVDRCVNDEALTKLVSKLRKALGDDPKAPQYIKTIPKKGYLLLFEGSKNEAKTPEANRKKKLGVWVIMAVLVVAVMLVNQIPKTKQASSEIEKMYERAESHYYQYTRLENESALKLYEKIVATDPNHALSQSGLANALVQKTLRWPNAINEPEIKHTNLLDAIEAGRLDTSDAQVQLARAEGLATRAAQLAPDNAKAQRTLGLVYATQQKFAAAEKQYLKAIALDPNEWGAMINLSELQQHAGQHQSALESLEQAFAAMTRVYQEEEVYIRPWYSKLGVSIAQKHQDLKQLSDAEIWYRRVLNNEPYNQEATAGMIRLLKQQGDEANAQSLCFEYQQKANPDFDCGL